MVACLRTAAARIVAITSLAVLAACGGGGGGGNDGPGFTVSPGSLAFSAPATSSPTPPPQTITIAVTGGTVYLAGLYGGAAIASATLAITGPTTAVITVYPASPATLGGGSHAGTVRVVGCNDVNCNSQVPGSPVDVNVTYQITGLAADTALTYTVGNTPAPADLTRQVVIGGSAGLTWTAASNVPWLSVAPESGGVGTTLTASLVQAQLDGMNNGTYSGAIALTPSTGSVWTIAVTLTISRTQVSYVAPYVAIANSSAEVIIRGDNFNQVSVQNVMFGSSAATTFAAVSDTEIHATHPALAAGSYPVRLSSSLGLSRSLATLAVVNAPTYAATTLAYPNATAKQPLEILYDAERQALVVAVVYPTPGASGDIFRYAYSGSAWVATPTSRAVASFQALDLATDGQKLLAVSDHEIRQVDPVTLAVTGTVTNAAAFESLAMANNGDAIITGFPATYRYSWRNPVLSIVGSYPDNNFYSGTPSASRDGSRIVIVQGGGLSPPPGVFQYLASTGTLSTTGLALNQNISIPPELDRTGARIVLNGQLVYDASYSLLGNLPAMTSGGVVVSPDGTRVYRYTGGTVLHTYDLTAALVGGLFPEIGSGITLPSSPGAKARIAISPDGKTVFIAGSDGIVVQPVP